VSGGIVLGLVGGVVLCSFLGWLRDRADRKERIERAREDARRMLLVIQTNALGFRGEAVSVLAKGAHWENRARDHRREANAYNEETFGRLALDLVDVAEKMEAAIREYREPAP
jgi:hypothetical protein